MIQQDIIWLKIRSIKIKTHLMNKILINLFLWQRGITIQKIDLLMNNNYNLKRYSGSDLANVIADAAYGPMRRF